MLYSFFVSCEMFFIKNGKININMAEHNEIGKLGENIAVKYLISKNFNIIERNFHVKGGEIDIIATKIQKNTKDFHVKYQNIAFVEVKTKKINSFKDIKDSPFSPENNLTRPKRQKLLKAIKHYLSYRKIKESDIDIKVIALIVYIETNSQQAKIKMYEDFIL